MSGITETGAVADLAGEPQIEGEWRDIIENVSGKEVVALHVTFSCITPNGKKQSDESGSTDAVLQFSHDHPIPPRREFCFKNNREGRLLGENGCGGVHGR